MQQGAKGMLVVAPLVELQCVGRLGKDCSCMEVLKGVGGIPVAGVSLALYRELQAGLKAGQVKGAVETRVSGTGPDDALSNRHIVYVDSHSRYGRVGAANMHLTSF
jgi:hypothetical protein